MGPDPGTTFVCVCGGGGHTGWVMGEGMSLTVVPHRVRGSSGTQWSSGLRDNVG